MKFKNDNITSEKSFKHLFSRCFISKYIKIDDESSNLGTPKHARN